MIFYFLLLMIIILTIKHIYEIHNINTNAVLEQLQNANSEEIFEHLKERKPLLIHNLGNRYEEYNNLSFEKLSQDNPGLIFNDQNRYLALKSFTEEDSIFIYKNPELYKSLQLKQLFDNIYSPFESKIHCNINYYLSLYKGLNSIQLNQNKHNLYIIHQIYGSSNLYLFNPKHKNDILNKSNDDIKKYGQKIKLTQGLVLYIPIEWYYFYQTDKESIIGETTSDNYFTIIYNNLR